MHGVRHFYNIVHGFRSNFRHLEGVALRLLATVAVASIDLLLHNIWKHISVITNFFCLQTFLFRNPYTIAFLQMFHRTIPMQLRTPHDMCVMESQKSNLVLTPWQMNVLTFSVTEESFLIPIMSNRSR